MRTLRNSIWLFLVLALGATTITLESCGSKKKRVPSTKIGKIKPEKVEISGDLKDYIEIVDSEYDITTEPWGDNEEYNAFVSIKIKAKKAIPANKLENKIPKIFIKMLDEKGNAITTISEFHLATYSVDPKLVAILKDGKGEESIKFQVITGGYNPEKEADKVKKFNATSKLEDKPEETKTESTTSSTNTESSSGTTDCATFAKEYGEFVDEYLIVYKKYMKDPSNTGGLSDYTALLDKLNKMNAQKDAQKDCMNDASYSSEILKHTQRFTKGLTEK
jgi:hypothetical protein